MNRTLAALTLGLTLILGLAPAAHAQEAVRQSSTSSAPGPVQVSKLFTTVTDNGLWWTTCVSFTNTSNRPIQAVQFDFTYLDAFDEPIASYKADRVGDFAPGVLIEGPDNASDYLTTGNSQKAMNCWRTVQVVGSLSTIKVEVGKVRYMDTGEVAVLEPKPSFTAQYLGNHPAKLKCGFGFLGYLTLPWEQLERTPKGRACIASWEKANGIAPDPTPTPATSQP